MIKTQAQLLNVNYTRNMPAGEADNSKPTAKQHIEFFAGVVLVAMGFALGCYLGTM